MTDIPVTIPAEELFRADAMHTLWPTGGVSYTEMAPGSAIRARVNRVTEALRDSYIRGAHDTAVHYEGRVEVTEAPKDETWKVTVPLGQGHRTIVVQSPAWVTTEDGMLFFGTRGGDDLEDLVDMAAMFAAGAWLSVVQQPENTAPVVES